ncbi:hypothetical protein [Tsukamurella sp. NPDC003166]|uniref:hypothetical protein n=1 Tax=Tsukamurella sp. NPDC003166 TaxID=3154444 RepID=UPI0033A8F688
MNTSEVRPSVDLAFADAPLRVVSFAGLLHRTTGDVDSYADAVTVLQGLGVGRLAAQSAQRMLDAIVESPIPEAEWEPMAAILGDELALLVGVSPSSMARYRNGSRGTPDGVAERLHVLTQIVADLAGSFNDYGIRRWFRRPRTALGGRAPSDILAGEWDADGPDARAVRDLAEALIAGTGA